MTSTVVTIRESTSEGPHAANPWLSHTAVIDAITPEAPGVSTYRLRLRDAAIASAYRFQPGQFNMLWVPGAGEVAISLSGDPATGGRLDHTIRVARNVTTLLSRMKPGDTIGLRGPYGSAWPLDAALGGDVVLIAGGIGLAPLRPAVLHLLRQRERYGDLALLYGTRSPATLLYPNEYAAWTSRGLSVQTTVDRAGGGWTGHVGVVTLLLDRLRLTDPRRTTVLICGPEVMMRFCARSALARGIPAENLWISAERNMQCAVGLCGHCQWGPEFVCKDGPVFRYDRIARFFAVEAL